MQLQIFPADGQSMFTYLEQLKAHLIPQREGVNVLRIYLPGRPVQRLYARVRRRAIPINPEYTYGLGAATVEFFCPDPRIYDDVEQSEPMTVGVGNTRVYPRTYPMLYNHVPSPPTLTVSNNGDYETWPTFTITGSCSNPQLTNVDTSQSLLFPINLGASDTLVVSSDLRTVELNGVPSRNLLGGAPQWWSFPPHQQVNMTFTVTTGTASCTVTWRDAYL